MKTLKILALTVCLSGCIYAGEVSLFPWRNEFVAGFTGYSIEYLNQKEEKLLSTENLQDSSFTANKLLTAFKGFPVADTKYYSKNYYVQESLIAPTDAQMSSGSSPAKIKGGQKYDVIARTKIDGKVNYLIDSGHSTFVYLVDEDYALMPYLGTIRNDKLVLLEEKNIISPENYKFEPVTKSRMLQSDIINGFEIKFEGVQNGMMLFTLMEYDAGGSTGEFSKYNFDNQPGVINIAGVKIKVFSAEDTRLEYMILAE